jgi:hypothetical protein
MSNFKYVIGAVILGIIPCRASYAAVNLLFDTASINNVNPGGSGTTITPTVNLFSSATGSAGDTTDNQVTGVDFFFQIAGPAGGTDGHFKITGRDLTGSAFPDTQSFDVTTSPNNLLNPSNEDDLGGSVSNPNTPVSNGTFKVATFTLSVASGTPNGTYTLTTFSSPSTTGYGMNAAHSFNDHPFDQHASMTITVVPEPSSAALIAGGLIGLALRRRRYAAR